MPKLSGWTRLWILLVVLYGIAVSIVTAGLLPKVSDVQRSWKVEPQASFEERTITIPNFGVINDVPITVSDDEVAQMVVIRLEEKIRAAEESGDAAKAREDKETLAKFLAIELRHKERSIAVPQRKKTILIGLLVWLLPSAAVYALGHAVGWVWAGFKKN